VAVAPTAATGLDISALKLCPCIQVLDMSGCVDLDDVQVYTFLLLFSSLLFSSLTLTIFTDQFLQVCAQLPELQSLDLTGCFRLTETSPLQQCLKLRRLNLSSCAALSNTMLASLSPCLHTLDLSSCW
jgi:hypothetical protein